MDEEVTRKGHREVIGSEPEPGRAEQMGCELLFAWTLLE